MTENELLDWKLNLNHYYYFLEALLITLKEVSYWTGLKENEFSCFDHFDF